jgi:hypothetical protein
MQCKDSKASCRKRFHYCWWFCVFNDSEQIDVLNRIFFSDEAWFDFSAYVTFKKAGYVVVKQGVNEYAEVSLYMHLTRRGKFSVYLTVFDNYVL